MNNKKTVNWLNILIGIVLMLVGTYGSTKGWGTPEFVHSLGLPLDLMKTVAAIGVFLICFPLLNVFYFQPLAESIETRTKSLEDTFAEAESLRKDMETTRAEYEARLKQTEQNARDQIQAEIKKAQELRAQIQAEANAKADEMLRKAREEIEAERDKVLTQVRVHVANLSLLATEKILGENVDDARNRKLVEEFMDKIEVPR